jgi:hypothetical protein
MHEYYVDTLLLLLKRYQRFKIKIGIDEMYH